METTLKDKFITNFIETIYKMYESQIREYVSMSDVARLEKLASLIAVKNDYFQFLKKGDSRVFGPFTLFKFDDQELMIVSDNISVTGKFPSVDEADFDVTINYRKREFRISDKFSNLLKTCTAEEYCALFVLSTYKIDEVITDEFSILTMCNDLLQRKVDFMSIGMLLIAEDMIQKGVDKETIVERFGKNNRRVFITR